MKPLIASVIAALSLLAQDGQSVNPSQGPPYIAYSSLFYYSGTDLIYACKARSVQPTASFTRAAATLTSIVDATNTSTVTTSTAHGLAVNDKIVISGATIATALNGTYAIATVGSTTTFTVTTSGVADAAYTESTLQFTTTAPRDTQAIWSVQKFTVAASLTTATQWANGNSAPNQICANRASLQYQ